MRSLRPVALAVLATLPFLALAQKRDGVYVPAGGSGTPWSLNENHTLIWGGQPYLPVGIRIDGTPEAVARAAAAGIKDVIVDLPASGAGWDETFAALKSANMRYLIRIDSLAPMARGVAVEPQAYRIAGITKPTHISVELPGASGAFVAVASRRDSSVSANGYVPIVDGKLTYDAKPGGDTEHVLLVYPETSSIEQPDFWEDLDRHRDLLLSSLKRHAPGPGLRGIVDPMGHTLSLPGRDLRFVPTSPYFRMELRDLIERRYRSVNTATRSWGLGTNDLTTFDDLARLVPLWQGSRGLGMVFDPATKRAYACENKRSSMWNDIAEVVNTAGARRFSRFVAAVRGVADVPVVQEWAGWSAPYENAAPAIDGVGMRASGATTSELIESASRASSTVARWTTKGWLAATDIDLGAGADAAAQVPAVLDDLGSLGARAFFVRTDSPKVAKAVADEAAKRLGDLSLANTSLQAIFYPENARNPANAQHLAAGRWWLPAPMDGNRVDLGSMFFGYRMSTPSGSVFAIWARQPGRYRLRLGNTKGVAFQALDGKDPNPKTAKGGIDVNLGEFPTLVTGTDEIPVPDLAFTETLLRFDFMMQIAEKRLTDITEERLYFKDFVSGFDRNPGGNFPQMRVQVDRLGAKVGDVTWIEAERTPDQNFSEAPNWPGCSGGAALVLRTPLPPGADGYYAEYRVPVKTTADQDVWIAASVPVERRSEVQVLVNGQVMPLTGAPVSLYGEGFGWYKLGVTRMTGTIGKLRVQVLGSGTSQIAIDAITLTPRPFTPNGISQPDPVLFPPLNGRR
ncbi:hypothetical protein [Fimbriimonas ginsengisoli]|uniref:Permease of the drug/metabolite transporter (DMT) superfamily n=1 Tax=Fimbriimonas ginsengisoli Gsoil 348 TaxID=661478 RepID=A0A068NSY2_FIMGI|nr:hypothetical protein [Fimbriimonas ginsengisoli]AIE86531.1 Permease of the drug/metabolite transporter (DMT) superfamily [Fimbriimonas ginsengisoli Gsoil 348]